MANLGAAKNMDSVFDKAMEDDLDFDIMFDEDDQLIEIVESFSERGISFIDEEVEFELNHLEDSETPVEDMRKEQEKEVDNGNKDAEGTDEVKLEDEPEVGKGESDADKELGLEDLDNDYNDGKAEGTAPTTDQVTELTDKEVTEAAAEENVTTEDEESMNKSITDPNGEGTGNIEVKDEAPAADSNELAPEEENSDASDKTLDPASNPSDDGKTEEAPVNGAEPTDSASGKESDGNGPTNEEKADNSDLSAEGDENYNDSATAAVKECDGMQTVKDECGDAPAVDNTPATAPSNDELLAQLAANLGYELVKKTDVAPAEPTEECNESECPECDPNKAEGTDSVMSDMDDELDLDKLIFSPEGDEEYNDSATAAVKEAAEDDEEIEVSLDDLEEDGLGEEDELEEDFDDAVLADAEEEIELSDEDEEALSYDPTDEELIDIALGDE